MANRRLQQFFSPQPKSKFFNLILNDQGTKAPWGWVMPSG